MKKYILPIILFFATSTGYSQVSFTTPVPKFGCPNTTHDVSIGVTNTSIISLPAGTNYSITITITDNVPAQIYTNTQTFSDGVPSGGTKYVTLPSIPFGAAMSYGVNIVLNYINPFTSAPGSFNTSTTYVVQDPPTLTISESPAGTLTISTLPDAAYSIRYYKDGDYVTPVDASTNGIYTPLVSGSYTAKAYEPFAACSSATASNAIVLSVLSSVTKAQQIQVAVYPNPMASSVTISTALDQTLTYEISDMSGTVLKTAEFTSVTNVNVESLKAGTYLISIKDKEERIASYKLVK